MMIILTGQCSLFIIFYRSINIKYKTDDLEAFINVFTIRLKLIGDKDFSLKMFKNLYKNGCNFTLYNI